MTEELIKIEVEKEKHIALWKINSAKSNPAKNILLTHGTFSNKKVLNTIAEYLVENGFTCWLFEWRNHGSSSKMSPKFNFETIGNIDFILVFNYLFEQCKLKKIDCITHSGGGICLTIALINHPKYANKINSISLFGCQAFGAAYTWINLIKIFVLNYFCKLYTDIPARNIGGVENESYHLMEQWFNWNLQKKFIGETGLNYAEKMKTIKIPILSIIGAGDTFIAPPNACQAFLDAFENPLNKSLYCAKSTGYSENYNHSRILHSRNASKEIYPSVLDWIKQHEPVLDSI